VRPILTSESTLLNPAKISVEGVSKSFPVNDSKILALDEISLSVKEGEFLCLVGPSGCGKSTLLNLIAGLETPEKGKILIDGEPIQGPGRDRLVMFQESALFPWLDVLGNVMFGLSQKPELSKNEKLSIARYYIKKVGLDHFEHANIHELSGGMKQRAALARSLAPNPRILLMDEPFAALDALTREQIYSDIQRIWAARQKTIIFVTHNVREAVCLGDRVLLFTPRPGQICKSFDVNLPRPRDFNSLEIAPVSVTITNSLRHIMQGTTEET